MSSRDRPKGIGGLVLSLLLLLLAGSVLGEDSELDDCLFESRSACARSEALGCVWCDLPKRCYSAARSLELGDFCNKRREVPRAWENLSTCDERGDRHSCAAAHGCVWCRSEAVEDACFAQMEAARLPRHIFSCPASNLA